MIYHGENHKSPFPVTCYMWEGHAPGARGEAADRGMCGTLCCFPFLLHLLLQCPCSPSHSSSSYYSSSSCTIPPSPPMCILCPFCSSTLLLLPFSCCPQAQHPLPAPSSPQTHSIPAQGQGWSWGSRGWILYMCWEETGARGVCRNMVQARSSRRNLCGKKKDDGEGGGREKY